MDHKRLNKRDCEVVLYGGEPLLPDNMENVESVLQASCRAGIPAAIIHKRNYHRNVSEASESLFGSDFKHHRYS